MREEASDHDSLEESSEVQVRDTPHNTEKNPASYRVTERKTTKNSKRAELKTHKFVCVFTF